MKEKYSYLIAIYAMETLNSMRVKPYDAMVVVDAFEAFNSINASSDELSRVFKLKVPGVDFSGCNKSVIAKAYVANDFNMREIVTFTELVEEFGVI